MGVVVAAHHLELDQTVAVKFLLEDMAYSAEGAERFRREARAAARIESDYVVRVLDVGVLDSGERYMVMEYLDGLDLGEELKLRERLPVEEACAYLVQACRAVAQAHAAGIVHRDLKPANLYLAQRTDGTRRVKILDFGISKSLTNTSREALTLTKTAVWVGSPLYMAPEQMQSARDVDERADIWSLGAILYEALTGQPPYLADTLPQLCNLLLNTDAPPVSDVCPDVPTELSAVVMRALIRSKEHRYQTADELALALAPFAPRVTEHSLPGSAVLQDVEVIGDRGSRVSVVASAGGGSGGPAAGVSPTQKSEPGIPVADRATAGTTASAWSGTTSGGTSRAPLIGGIVALGVAAGVAFAFLRPDATAPREGEADAAELAGAPTVVERESPPTLEGSTRETPPPSTDEASDEDAIEEGEDSAAKEAAKDDESASTPPSANAAASKPPPTRAASRPPPRPRPRQPEPAGTPPDAGGLSDFGGRR